MTSSSVVGFGARLASFAGLASASAGGVGWSSEVRSIGSSSSASSMTLRLERFLDLRLQLEHGQLQQLDRLLQLRRHRQLLTELELQGRLEH